MLALPNDFLQSLEGRDDALAECLRDALAWPGVDGLTLDDVLAARNDANPTRPAPNAAGHRHVRRWLVFFASGPDWYPVGEFVGQDAAAAIQCAIEVFGGGTAYQAAEVP